MICLRDIADMGRMSRNQGHLPGRNPYEGGSLHRKAWNLGWKFQDGLRELDQEQRLGSANTETGGNPGVRQNTSAESSGENGSVFEKAKITKTKRTTYGCGCEAAGNLVGRCPVHSGP